MKTKPFLLATAGSTVDGRVIDEKMLEEMAAGYNPKTYGARVNLEHIRGITGEKPFRAYGDVLELSVGEVDVDFHGKTEKRKGLFGVLDVTEEAKQLNAQGQKVYPSIEIEPNFAGKGQAYLMGVALTDSPASVATERLQFNTLRPGALTLSRDTTGQSGQPGLLEFADATTEEGDTFITRFGAMLDGVFSKFTQAKPNEPAPEPKPDDQPAQFNVADMKPLFEQLGQTFATEIGTLRTEMREEVDRLSVKISQVEQGVEKTPANNHSARPVAAGPAGQYAKTDC